MILIALEGAGIRVLSVPTSVPEQLELALVPPADVTVRDDVPAPAPAR